jgi:DNA-binding NarL/FixJ family response regulator
VEHALEVLIVSSQPSIAGSLERWLEDGPQPVRCRSVPHPDAAPDFPERGPHVLVAAPRTWEEMSRWAPPLQRRFAATMWLMLADLRVAGLFLSVLQRPPLCAIVNSPAAPDDFQAAFWSLTSGDSSCKPDNLLARISTALGLPAGRRPPPLTPRELECACALSLGLSNRQIAATFGVAQDTVKNELYGLYRKLGLHTREQVANAVERVIFPDPHLLEAHRSAGHPGHLVLGRPLWSASGLPPLSSLAWRSRSLPPERLGIPYLPAQRAKAVANSTQSKGACLEHETAVCGPRSSEPLRRTEPN